VSGGGSLGVYVDRLLRASSKVLLALIVVFMATPAVIVAILSFSNTAFIHFPPAGWGFRQYRTLATQPEWIDAIQESAIIASAVVVISVVVGVAAVFALYRTTLPFSQGISFLAIVPLMIPQVAYAIGMYAVLAEFGLLGSRFGLILCHVVITFPLVILVVSATIIRLPRELELVALTLGASRLRAWTGITMRLLAPAIFAGAVFAFVTSFDEPVFVSFVGGPGLITLPKAILDSVRFGLDAVITAIAALLMATTALLLIFTTRMQRS
jgi:ABC-type spermidine/putrescine transport system permease subunit II